MFKNVLFSINFLNSFEKNSPDVNPKMLSGSKGRTALQTVPLSRIFATDGRTQCIIETTSLFRNLVS